MLTSKDKHDIKKIVDNAIDKNFTTKQLPRIEALIELKLDQKT